MARYHVTLSYDGVNVNAVKKKAKEFFGGDADVIVEKATNPTSRSDRYSEAESEFENSKSEVEGLKDELEEWQQNLPENLQNGTKNDELQEAIDGLSEVLDQLESVDFQAITFPSMF